MSLSKPVKSEFVAFKSDGVWQYFLREKSGQSAQCKECHTVIKTAGGTTTGLHVHLKSKHNIDLSKRKADDKPAVETDTSGPSSSKMSCPVGSRAGPMAKFVMDKNERSLEATIARMTARDGLPFRVFVSSPDLRKALMSMGHSSIPKSESTIKKMVMDHGSSVRSFVIGEMRERKKKGDRFSLTFDEWTSVRNRRYMCVNVHAKDGKFWSLGLVRVYGSMPAEKCVQLLETRLAEFGLSLSNDIVCIVTDGASVMTKVGKLIAAQQQLCYAHGVQLAVLDVLYKTPTVRSNAGDAIGEESDDQVSDADGSTSDEDSDTDIIAELSDSYQAVVNKVRKIVKIFKRSPTKNDAVLQKYVKMDNEARECALLLDCRTRWSSLFNMLNTFYRLRNAIQKACIDVKAAVSLTDCDITLINELVSALAPVKVAVDRLCRRETNLLDADVILQFAVVQLEKQSSELGKTLAIALRRRVMERHTDLSGLLQYLNNPNVNSTTKCSQYRPRTL